MQNEKKEAVKHSPTPWSLDEGHPFYIYCDDAMGAAVAYTHFDQTTLGDSEELANAAHIVRCVNSHDALREALEDFPKVDKACYKALMQFGSLDEAVKAIREFGEKARAALALSAKED